MGKNAWFLVDFVLVLVFQPTFNYSAPFLPFSVVSPALLLPEMTASET